MNLTPKIKNKLIIVAAAVVLAIAAGYSDVDMATVKGFLGLLSETEGTPSQ